VATVIDLSAGVSSADTRRRLVSAPEPKAFGQGFEAWARSMVEQMPEMQLAIDGETIRGSERLGLPAVDVVRAFVVNNHLVLGQLATEVEYGWAMTPITSKRLKHPGS
jgi:hypothetical protein